MFGISAWVVLKLLYKVVENLAKEQPLAPKYKDNPLKGGLKDFRECHLKTGFIACL